MASLEMQLLSRIVRKGLLSEALNWGITLQDFLTDEGRHFMAHLLSYAQNPNRGRLGPFSIREIYPTFNLVDDEQTTFEALCYEVRRARLGADLRAVNQVIANDTDDPISSAARAEAMLKNILDLGYGKKTDVFFGDSLDRTIERHDLKKRGIDLSVIHWPWPTLNQESGGGIEPADYIIYYGRPKSMKSWVLAEHIAYTYNAGKKPLIYTKEMHPDNIFMRVAACIARLPYQELRSGRLTDEEYKRLRDLRNMVREMRECDDIICLSGRDAPSGSDTVDWLHAKTERHKPHAIFIDGMYLMSDSKGSTRQKDNERVQSISRDLRQMALSTKIPIICTLQANRKAAAHSDANLDELAFSDAVGQDATAILRVINEKDKPTIALVIAGSREYELHGLRIGGVPAVDFSEKEVMSEKEIKGAKDKDTGEEPEKKNGSTKPKKTDEEKKVDKKVARNERNARNMHLKSIGKGF